MMFFYNFACLLRKRLAVVAALVIVFSVFGLSKVQAQPCTGTAPNGDYSYEVYTSAGTVFFKFHPLAPIAGSNLAILNIKNFGGFGMAASGADFEFSKAIADGTIISFFFTYNTPPAGERNTSATPHTYVVGSVCVAGAPTVAITSPFEGQSYAAPASITIDATAADADGTIAKVDFYDGTTLIGTDNTSPYSFVWTSVPAGPYVLTAKATDNSNLSTNSIPVNIVVNTPNTNGYCGTAVSGDYEYKAETVNGVVTYTMHPLQPIAGCAYAIIFVREGLSGGYPGYPMTAVGSDFIFTKTITDGTPTSIYFTYQTPPAGERNSSANPHSYVVGTNCTGITGSAPAVSISAPADMSNFTAPANITLSATATDADGTIANVEFYNGLTLLGTSTTSPYSINWANVAPGNYSIIAKATDNAGLSSVSAPIKVVVSINNAAGFCGTSENGDYSYKFETAGDVVTFQFHPLTPILGSNNALIYIREGSAIGYPGYPMTALGGDFTFSKTIATGTPLSIYFTYAVPSGGERNSAATPHSYTVGAVCLIGAFPVTLLNFDAALQSGGNVAINWAATNEQNNDYFIVEKSTNGIQFTTLAKVAASQNGMGKNVYSAMDVAPAGGKAYYRLVQVDKDGKKTIYAIRTIELVKAVGTIKLYPNPLQGKILNVTLPNAGSKTSLVQLFDMAGKLIYKGMPATAGNTMQIKLFAKPAAGVYQLVLEGHAPVKVVVN